MSNLNKEQILEETIKQLSEDLNKAREELDKLKAKPKWQPQGEYVLMPDGTVHGLPRGTRAPRRRLFGNSFPTREAAEEAAKHLRVTYRLLAYVAEFAPGFKQPALGELVPPYTGTVWKGDDGWCYSLYLAVRERPGVVYMPYDVAVQLVEKLNSGEVEL